MMKKNTIPFIALLLVLGCGESKRKPPAPIVSKETNQRNSFEKGFLDSLRQQITNIKEERDIEQLLCQQWEHEEDKIDSRHMDYNSQIEVPYRGFAFFKDGKVLKNPHGQAIAGTWMYDDAAKTITVKSNNGATEQYKINAIAVDELVLSKVGDNRAQRQKYVGQTFVHKVITDDPFYPANNTWRMKPASSETDEAIRKRVKGCVKFYMLYFADAIVRDSSMISFTGLPGCFKWYSGGIGIINAKELPDSWMDCFYNKQQALKGQALMEEVIVEKYDWPYSNHWVIQTAFVLQQVYGKL